MPDKSYLLHINFILFHTFDQDKVDCLVKPR